MGERHFLTCDDIEKEEAGGFTFYCSLLRGENWAKSMMRHNEKLRQEMRQMSLVVSETMVSKITLLPAVTYPSNKFQFLLKLV